MINEQLIVDQILTGKKINVYQMRFAVTLLARYYLSQGLNQLETREKIFEWANANTYHIKVGVKRIISDVASDLRPLAKDIRVFINNADIDLIKAVANTKLERKVALAFLCYAKVYADGDGIVEMPIATVVDWIGQKDPHNTYTRIMPRLFAKGFFTNEEDVQKWHGHIVKRTRTMRLCCELNNKGKHELVDNDFDTLYNSIKWKNK